MECSHPENPAAAAGKVLYFLMVVISHVVYLVMMRVSSPTQSLPSLDTDLMAQ